MPTTPLRIQLFVDGPSALARRAESGLKRYLLERPQLLARLEVFSVHEDIEAAIRHRVIATPCVVVTDSGGRHRKIIGDCNDQQLLDRFFHLDTST